MAKAFAAQTRKTLDMSMPSKTAIAQFWAKQPLTDPLTQFVDLGEPTCMACEYYESGWDADGDEALEKCWQRARLERAHIVARSQSGSDDASNFVLLCAECHKAAPMVTDRKYMLLWCRSREKYHTRLLRAIEAAARAYGVDGSELERHDDAEVKRALTQAQDEGGIGTHFGEGVSIASHMVVVARMCEILKRQCQG